MFDPYHRWLGIPKEQRPPTHYQILAIQPTEQDPEVIEEAAVRQTTHVRSYQLGEHADDCARVLNEIALARSVLLNPAKRKEYDAKLGVQTGIRVSKSVHAVTPDRPAPKVNPFAAIDLANETAPPLNERMSRKSKAGARSGAMLWLGLGLCGAATLAVVLAVAMSNISGSPKKDIQAQANNDKKLPKKKPDDEPRDKKVGVPKPPDPKDKGNPKEKDSSPDPPEKLPPQLGEKGFVPLFNGQDLAGWKSFLKDGGEDDGTTFRVLNGVLVISGQPHGYLYTTKSYRNYKIKLDWRYERPANLVDDRTFKGDSGLLMHVTGAPKVWPDSVQVQWYYEHYGLIYLWPHVPNKNYTWNQSAMGKAMRPVGAWNSTEVISRNGEIRCTLNGVEVGIGQGKLVEGQIGLQSEGAEIHFKNIEIMELPAER